MDAPACSLDGKERLRIRLTGAVQGVGFRPHVFRLASALCLGGFVDNHSAGLHIEVEGPADRLSDFLQTLRDQPPPHALILTWDIAWLPPLGYPDFHIAASDGSQPPTAAILPDLAPCGDCIHEFLDDPGRRQGYPFTNCTACGPRFTIVRSLPYDRPNTALADFALCPDCRREYEDPADRRFHAQPIACPVCGPRLDAPLEDAVALLRSGGIVALQGVGGYQLLVSAADQAAILRLRERKRREWKPFAVLVPHLEAARALASLTPSEEELLSSSAAPIVLALRHPAAPLAPAVCGVSPWLGLMLPASPLHHLLVRLHPEPLVCTSGNLSGEPIATSPQEAHARLHSIAGKFVSHNRPILRPCDDSVARVVAGRPMVLRRARGYAPLPVPLPSSSPPLLAVGGHLKSTIALSIGRQAILSQHLGDLDSPETRALFTRTIDDFRSLYSFSPEAIVCDLHPDYFSTQWAEAAGLPLYRVQHHEAHALSCLAENDAREPALAVCWDGTGYGHDGAIWGSEFFLVDGPRLERIDHLRPFLLPGGDASARDCGRSAAGMLHALGLPVEGPLGHVLQRRTACVPTTSMGRLFDAVAWLTGLAWHNRFEGEAGLALEAAARASSARNPYPLAPGGDWSDLIQSLRRDMAAGVLADALAARFHFSLVEWIAAVALRHRVHQVALSGGCFQNALLTAAVHERLTLLGMRVLLHQSVPPNDGGLSLGQLAWVLRRMQPAR